MLLQQGRLSFQENEYYSTLIIAFILRLYSLATLRTNNFLLGKQIYHITPNGFCNPAKNFNCRVARHVVCQSKPIYPHPRSDFTYRQIVSRDGIFNFQFLYHAFQIFVKDSFNLYMCCYNNTKLY